MNRGPSAYQPNALPLGQTGSQFCVLINKCPFEPSVCLDLEVQSIRSLAGSTGNGVGWRGAGGGGVKAEDSHRDQMKQCVCCIYSRVLID